MQVVGRVHDLARRDSRVHVHQVDRAPDGRVEVDALPPGEALGERRVGDARMGDDQRPLRVGVVQDAQVVGDQQGRPRPPWMRIGTAARRQARKSARAAGRQQEALGPWVSLIPRAPGRGSASPPRPGRRRGRGGRRERSSRPSVPPPPACGRWPPGTQARGRLVHAERKRPLRARAEELDQLLARRDHPVDVAADVDASKMVAPDGRLARSFCSYSVRQRVRSGPRPRRG